MLASTKEALRNRLIAAGVNGGAAIFDSLAPSGQAYPYIVFAYVGGGYENQTALDSRNEVWQVVAISDEHSTAQNLAAAIGAALHQQSLSVAGWGHLMTTQLDPLWRVETLNHQQIYTAGATFRLRLYKS
jgi:hypothetical protein